MEYSDEIIEKLNSIKGKRPSTVIRHILERGYITTEELENLYGYKHPPRAIRDVKERGVNIEKYQVKSSDGKTIGAYRFGAPVFSDNKISKVTGRTGLSQALKKALLDKYGARCFVYNQPMKEQSLQIDHRIPYEIGGNCGDDIECYMLLSPAANRAKSWTCEHCQNWDVKDPNFCEFCFWSHPETYTHIAGETQKVIVIKFTNDEVEDYNRLIKLVGEDRAEEEIKRAIKLHILNK